MKLSLLALLTIAGAAMAKNVVDLDKFKISAQNEKRSPKNVIDLSSLLKLGGKSKREAKNIISLEDFKAELDRGSNIKRDPKNLFDTEQFENAATDDGNKRRSEYGDNEDETVFILNEEDSSKNLLQSTLPQIREISVFAGYLRDNVELYEKTEKTDEVMVIISPTDEALTNKLNGLKPWQFPAPLEDNASPEENEKTVRNNLNSFLSGHIVINFESTMTFEEDNTVVSRLLNGELVKIRQNLETEEYHITTGEEWINVSSMKQVDNGFIFVIDDVLVKPE